MNDGKFNEEELKKYSIYHMKNENFEKNLKEGKLDYEFILINEETLENKIKEIKDRENNKNSDIEISRFIEKLPGRIIVLGDKENFLSKDNKIDSKIIEWLKKRMVFITEDEFNQYEIILKIDEKNLENIKVEKFKLKLYDIWIRERWGENIKLSLYIKKEDKLHGTSIVDNETFLKILKGIITNKIEENKTTIERALEFSVLYPVRKGLLQPNFFSNDKNKYAEKIKPSIQELLKSSLPINEIIDKVDISPIFVLGPIESIIDLKNEVLNWLKLLISEELKNLTEEVSHIYNSIKKYKLKIPIKSPKLTIENEKSWEIAGQNNNQAKIIRYERHGDCSVNPNWTNNPAENWAKGYYYFESLSGASTHFGLMASALQGNDKYIKDKMIYQMIENGPLRILVADERVARFVGKDEKIRDALICAGIDVINNIDGLEVKTKNSQETKSINIGNFAEGNLFKYDNIKKIAEDEDKGYDILLIHQGILDKVRDEMKGIEIDWEGTFNHWKIKYFPYVVVTSGRGTPENIPENAKFVPFSTIEQALMSIPHQKFILSQILMKTLSVKKEGNR